MARDGRRGDRSGDSEPEEARNSRGKRQSGRDREVEVRARKTREEESGEEDYLEDDERRRKRKKSSSRRERSDREADKGDSDGDFDRRSGRLRQSNRNHKAEEATDSEEDSETESDSAEERRRRRKGGKKRQKTRSRKRDESSEESESEDEQPSRRKRTGVAEEELQEYLKKKAQRKSLKLARKLKTDVVAGYTNESNPFGDSNLNERFVWKKKIERDVSNGLDIRTINLKAEKKRQEELMAEVAKVKKRREERELEKARHEEELAMLQRERTRAEAVEHEQKEEEFHFQQTKLRAEIRAREGRARPIDRLSRNLNAGYDFDVVLEDPCSVFQGLAFPEMEELRQDLAMHEELDTATPVRVEFWHCMVVVCDHEIADAKRRDVLARARVRGEEPPAEVMGAGGLHMSVDIEVQGMLQGKGYAELAKMEEEIMRKMREGSAKVVEYWEAVVKRLVVWKARARLREIHEELLALHLKKLQEVAANQSEELREVREETRRLQEAEERVRMLVGGDETVRQGQSREEEGEAGTEMGAGRGEDEGAPKGVDGVEAEAGGLSPGHLGEEVEEREPEMRGKGEGGEGGGWGEGGEEEGRKAGGVVEESGGFSPQYVREEDETEAVDPEEDRQEMEARRREVVELERRKAASGAEEAATRPGVRGAEEGGLSREEMGAAMRMMGHDEGDVAFGGEVNLQSQQQVYWWHDKFRPRKPKYFNRVHTGYEWSKYNQTHYDHDNPPPKVVQGYKFNIFYPDLIDKSKAPTYVVDRDPSSKDGSTCFIRFHAGPPYEDIAFRIVNKEWEYSHKKGFKSTFERGILHVYFNFRRYKYRR